MLGAAAGAATNYAYTSYYQQMAHVHFGLRKLARKHVRVLKAGIAERNIAGARFARRLFCRVLARVDAPVRVRLPAALVAEWRAARPGGRSTGRNGRRVKRLAAASSGDGLGRYGQRGPPVGPAWAVGSFPRRRCQ